MEYDPLLAKLAVWAADREEATGRMIRALREYDVGGIRTNIGFFRQILEDARIRRRPAAHRIHRGIFRAPSAAAGAAGFRRRWRRWRRRCTRSARPRGASRPAPAPGSRG